MNFKIGDFVRQRELSSTKIFKIDEFDGEGYHLENEIHWVQPIQINLWEPKEGEFVWFYKGIYKNEPKLVRYNYNVHGNYIEPFMNRLPSFIEI